MLRPEFAALYPGLTPGVWEIAATVAEHLLMRLGGVPPGERLLPEEHFEFRGGGREAFRWAARSRLSDVEFR
jgi:hypothetical protein